MPSGLLQMVGEAGWRLSHGEQSRLYIAWALLQGADVVVLDESFAAPGSACTSYPRLWGTDERQRASKVAPMPPYVCIQQSRPGESGAAAIATLAQYYGLPLGYRDMRSILGLESLKLDLFYLLFASRKFGFQAVPLEGDYADLPEVARPNIVVFKGEDQEEIAFRVLYEINAEAALIGNVETGEIERLNKETFSQLWTGDAV